MFVDYFFICQPTWFAYLSLLSFLPLIPWKDALIFLSRRLSCPLLIVMLCLLVMSHCVRLIKMNKPQVTHQPYGCIPTIRNCCCLLVSGAFEKKNVTKSGKSPKGVSSKNQKVQNSKFGLFDKRGGEAIFSFFSQIQMFTLDTSVEEKIS